MNQEGVIQAFNEVLMNYADGSIDYDQVEEELSRLAEDEDITINTYERCVDLWDDYKMKEQEEFSDRRDLDDWVNKQQGWN